MGFLEQQEVLSQKLYTVFQNTDMLGGLLP